jgi:hypothetical protein
MKYVDLYVDFWIWGNTEPNTVPLLSMSCNTDVIPAGSSRWYVRYNLHQIVVVRTRQLGCLCHDFFNHEHYFLLRFAWPTATS